MTLISLGIKRSLLSALLVTIAVLTPYVVAGVNTGLTPLPEDSHFQTDDHRTRKILEALFYENQQKYHQAYQLWESLPTKDGLVAAHLFQTGFSLTDFEADTKTPESESEFLLTLRFYLWQKKWDKALELINTFPFASLSKVDTKLEIVRSYLYFGMYEEAERLLNEISDFTTRGRLHHAILDTWLGHLSGNQSKVSQQMAMIEENFLYLPLSLLMPETDLGSSLYRQSIIRFPSNEVILERLVLIYQENGEWEALWDLIRSQEFLHKSVFSYYLLAEVFLNTNRFDDLKALNKGRRLRKVTPEMYDVIARKAIKERNWELLHTVANILQKKFPSLQDGSLYLVIYLSETGRREEAERHLKKTGVNLPLP